MAQKTSIAASLPEGSIVATHNAAFIARRDNQYGHQLDPRWEGTLGATNHDRGIDILLSTGAQVLRRGSGEE